MNFDISPLELAFHKTHTFSWQAICWIWIPATLALLRRSLPMIPSPGPRASSTLDRLCRFPG
jgi:hypothetical protein